MIPGRDQPGVHDYESLLANQGSIHQRLYPKILPDDNELTVAPLVTGRIVNLINDAGAKMLREVLVLQEFIHLWLQLG